MSTNTAASRLPSGSLLPCPTNRTALRLSSNRFIRFPSLRCLISASHRLHRDWRPHILIFKTLNFFDTLEKLMEPLIGMSFFSIETDDALNQVNQLFRGDALRHR